MAICRKCTAEYSDARHKLGYLVCLPCGEVLARDRKFCVVTLIPKVAPTVVTDFSLLKGAYRKGG